MSVPKIDFDFDDAQVFRGQLDRLTEEHVKARDQLASTLQENARLLREFTEKKIGTVFDRRSHRAALNLLEDAIESRNLATLRAAELERSREALRELNAGLSQQVREQTHELRELASLAQHRADRLAALSEELMRAEQRERRRVAQILHEHIQQLLVGAKMQLEAAAGHTNGAQTDGDQAYGDQSYAVSLVQEAIEACRSLAVELSPPVLASEGLVAAIEWLAARMEKRHRLTVEVEAGSALQLASKDLQDLLFHAVRELLLNVVKHAETDRATVRIDTPTVGQIRIEVCDQGTGFIPGRPEESPVETSWGLFHIGERLDQIGGLLSIDSSPGSGTRVTLIAPCQSGEEKRNGLSAPSRSPPGLIAIVLVLDDSEASRSIAAFLDRRAEIIVAGEAHLGRTGLDLVRDFEPHLVIVDGRLEDVDGIDVTREIRLGYPEVPVIVVLEDVSPASTTAFLAAGAMCCLPKQAHAELADTIRTVGTNRSESRPAQMTKPSPAAMQIAEEGFEPPTRGL